MADPLACIQAARRDFVMLDIRLPGGDGIAVVSALKRLNHPPLVGMQTHYPLDPYRRRCLALGADFFWDKSKDLAAIPEAFRALTTAGGGSTHD